MLGRNVFRDVVLGDLRGRGRSVWLPLVAPPPHGCRVPAATGSPCPAAPPLPGPPGRRALDRRSEPAARSDRSRPRRPRRASFRSVSYTHLTLPTILRV